MIGLVDIDSKIPNLALMKLSAYHKDIGDTVELTSPLFAKEYDEVYASKVFLDTPMPVLPTERRLVGVVQGITMHYRSAWNISCLTTHYTNGLLNGVCYERVHEGL